MIQRLAGASPLAAAHQSGEIPAASRFSGVICVAHEQTSNAEQIH